METGINLPVGVNNMKREARKLAIAALRDLMEQGWKISIEDDAGKIAFDCIIDMMELVDGVTALELVRYAQMQLTDSNLVWKV